MAMILNPYRFGIPAAPLPVALKSGLVDWYGFDGDLSDAVTPANAGVAAGPFAYDFTGSAQGWTTAGANLTVNASSVTVSSFSNDPNFLISNVSAFAGNPFRYLWIRIKRLAGSGWDGTIFYCTTTHSFTASYRKTFADPTGGVANGVFYDVVVDMWALSAGGADWQNGSITSLRLDFGNSAPDVFEVDSVYASASATERVPGGFYETSTIAGQRLHMTGGSWVALPNVVGNNGTQTVAVWATGSGGIYSKGSDASGVNGWGLILVDSATNVSLSVVTTSPSAQAFVADLAHGIADPSTPRLYVATFDNTNKVAAISVNGGAPATVATGQNLRGADNVYVGVNRSSPTFGNMRQGSLDQMGFWNRVLNSAEIATLYNNGAGCVFL